MSMYIAFPPNNGTNHNTTLIIKHMMSSAAKAKFGALYINSKFATLMKHTLAKMGHLQPPTPIQTNNSTTYGIIANKIVTKATKAMVICFQWPHNWNSKTNSDFIGNGEKQIMPITGQSIISSMP